MQVVERSLDLDSNAGMGTRDCEDAPVRSRRRCTAFRPSVSLYRERAAVVVEGARVRSRFLSAVIRGFLSAVHVSPTNALIYDDRTPVTKQIFNVM